MANAADLITVYRSADMNAGTDASAVHRALLNEGLGAVLLNDQTSGVVVGTWEVRVPSQEAARAEEIVGTMNQDEPAQLDASHEMDLVTIWELQGTTAELEAIGIMSILEASNIPVVVTGSSTLPNLSFRIQVPASDVDRATAVVKEAQAAGPAAAVEAERESEQIS
ncbi:MAG TPA: DUF2007 domain-containing protein [Bryobacteraceae bacterium]|nr:DUF2007 domain-containing protein [Bryobacteraceae bacterium]